MTKNHKDDIKDWSAVETFCDAMAVIKKKETRRKADQKRAEKPERKEALKKADQKREPLRAQRRQEKGRSEESPEAKA